MKQLVAALLIAGSTFAQTRPARRVFTPPAASKDFSFSAGYAPATRRASSTLDQAADMRGPARASRSTAADVTANTTPQAPGVMQVNLGDPNRSSWFVSTDLIPKGSIIQPYILPPGSVQQILQLQPIVLNNDLAAGTSLMLPQIGSLGDFWPSGIMTYDVLVKLPDGTNTHTLADFCTNCARNFQDLSGLFPLIYDASESLQSDGSIFVTVNGVFMADPVKVVFEGLAVPAGAISRGNNNSVIVNVSQVPGMRLDLLQDFLLTISQDGFSDTRSFTHVPFQPGTYIPSP